MVYMEGSRNRLLNLYEKEQVEVSTYDAIHALFKVKLNLIQRNLKAFMKIMMVAFVLR